MNKQNSGIKAFFTVLMCIPLVFIVYFAVIYTNHNIPVSQVVSVTVTAGDGTEYVYSDEESRSFFLDVYLDAVANDSLTQAPEGASGIKVFCDRGDKRIDYTLYPSLDGNKVLLQDSNGHFYDLPESVEQKLLVRSELQYLYADSLLPQFTVVTGDKVQTILPVKYNWSYKKADGNFYKDDITTTFTEDGSTRIYSDRDNAIRFSVEPDNIELRINGESVAPGSFSSLAYSADTPLAVTVRATWNENKEAGTNYGTAEYSFNVLYDIPAKVYLSSDTCYRGETLLLRVDMLTDGETVDLQTDLITTQPQFAVQGDAAYAILPVSLENDPGEYMLNFASGENSVKLTLRVEDKDYGFGTYFYSSEVFESHVASAKIDEFKEIINSTVVSGGVTFFSFSDPFAHACQGTVVETFGKSIVINDESGSSAPFNGYVPGTVYAVEAGTEVTSMQRGKIVFAGETALTGKTVIISHGMGIYTYYFHMSEISVAEGDTVLLGKTIGKTGNSNLSNADSASILHTAVSVGDVFVSAQDFIDGNLFN